MIKNYYTGVDIMKPNRDITGDLGDIRFFDSLYTERCESLIDISDLEFWVELYVKGVDELPLIYFVDELMKQRDHHIIFECILKNHIIDKYYKAYHMLSYDKSWDTEVKFNNKNVVKLFKRVLPSFLNKRSINELLKICNFILIHEPYDVDALNIFRNLIHSEKFREIHRENEFVTHYEMLMAVCAFQIRRKEDIEKCLYLLKNEVLPYYSEYIDGFSVDKLIELCGIILIHEPKNEYFLNLLKDCICSRYTDVDFDGNIKRIVYYNGFIF